MTRIPEKLLTSRPIQTIKNNMVRHGVVDKITNSLTGNFEDLRQLTGLLDTEVANDGLRAFLTGLERDISNRCGLAKLFTRVGAEVNSKSKKKLIQNLIYNWGYVGENYRLNHSTLERWIPSLMVVSPTMRCNLNCTGCYSGLYEKDGELSEDELDRLFSEAKSEGMYFAVISGGEPFVKKKELFRLFKKHNDMYFLVYTNGTLIDEKTAKKLGELGNVAPAISVEGYKEETDQRRGKGIYDKIMNAMDNLRNEGVLFGISVTYTRNNIDTVTSEEFVQYFINKGAIFAWYFMFMPVGKDPILDLVPTPQQRVYCGKKIGELRTNYPFFMADFWNDGPAASGCMAGARNYLHILNSGRVEPCVFAHFGKDNIRDKSLLEAANSQFFKAIRSKFPYNENANLKRPCMIIDNPEVLRELIETYPVDEGHEHSEDLVRDPSIIEWINNYAREFKELTDPEWEEEISNPENRWYKDGEEYKDLFKFQKHNKKQKEKEKEGTTV